MRSVTNGDSAPISDELFSEAYEELRRLARRMNGGRGSLTWNPTALVNEVYVRLAQSKGVETSSPLHLKHTIIRAMRHILIDAARKKAAVRRGGGNVPVRHVPLDENSEPGTPLDPEEILSVNLALNRLESQNEFQARVFECQFFGGLQVGEIAALLGSSEKKVQRNLRLARAYLSALLVGDVAK